MSGTSSEPFLLDAANQVIVEQKLERSRPDPPWGRLALRLVRKQFSWWWLSWLWIAAIFSLPGFLAWQDWRELHDHGLVAEAHFSEGWEEQTRFGPSRYFARYVFDAETEEGVHSYSLDQEVSAAEYQELTPNSTSAVLYSARDPNLAWFLTSDESGSPQWPPPPLLSLLTVELWIIAVLFVLTWLLLRYRRAYRLLREGELLTGRIVECRRLRRGSPQATIRYHFVGLDGHNIFGTLWPRIGADVLLPPGTKLRVLYLNRQNFQVL